jgi:hypothetical protein
MSEERKQEIITILQGIYTGFSPSPEEPELTMFGLITRYNAIGGNVELIGGDWVVKNCPEPLCSLE